MNAQVFFNTMKFMYEKEKHKISINVSRSEGSKELYIYISLDNVWGHSRVSITFGYSLSYKDYYCVVNPYEYQNEMFLQTLVLHDFLYDYGTFKNNHVTLEQLSAILTKYLELEKNNKYDAWLNKEA
jgi:hypothetical protein